MTTSARVELPATHDGLCDWPDCDEAVTHAVLSRAYAVNDEGEPLPIAETDEPPLRVEDVDMRDARLVTMRLHLEIGYFCRPHVTETPEPDADLIGQMRGDSDVSRQWRGSDEGERLIALIEAFPEPVSIH